MHFQTVFDVVEAGYKNWSFPAFGLILVILFGLCLRFPKFSGALSQALDPGTRRTIDWLGFIFAVSWVVGTFVGTLGEYLSARHALLSGQFEVVEGRVAHFKTTPKQESFEVTGRWFEYSDSVVVPGFNNTRLHGGPIQEGKYVRVTYRGNAILRLKIAR